MTKVEEAAQWMWDELQAAHWLSQYEAVIEIGNRFGDDLTYINDRGNPAIDKRVLRRFRLLHQGKAQWYKPPDGYWQLES